MDKDTMVEALKFLNYSQLAKSSLVSKRFRNLIQIHRHYLARLYVDEICFDHIYHIEMAKMNNSIPISSAAIKVYDKELSPEEYDEWVICNNYSKQVPLEDQVTSAVSTQNDRKGVYFSAYAYYKDPSNRGFYDRSAVLIARVEFRDENWPLFQHFVRLVTDPLIYINRVHLAYQIDVLNLLAIAINSDHNRLQCKQLNFDLEGNFDKSITWIKNYVRCNRFYVYGNADLNHDEAFLDFFLNGGNCTSFINVGDPSESVVDFMRKFMNLKNTDEIQLVEAIEGRFKGRAAELLNRNYAQFIVKEERHHYGCDCAILLIMELWR
ncbi:hypothetical protein Ddc_09186 [Ditylenchus destructor]|nr:hypothetical protein Ddc_09186 [Ditylenchus destructor]